MIARRRARILGVATAAALALSTIAAPVPPTAAQQVEATLSAFGSATVDGKLGTGEWDDAARFDFTVVAPPANGGGPVPAALYVMNDETNLYLAVRVGISFDRLDASIAFDNDDDGAQWEQGDDWIAAGRDDRGQLRLFDAFRILCASGGTFEWCVTEDVATSTGVDPVAGVSFPAPGTTDGVVAEGLPDGVPTDFLEFAHPLNSGDAAHDFSLAPGSAVGFLLGVSLTTVRCPGDCARTCQCAWSQAGPSGESGHIVIAGKPIPGGPPGPDARPRATASITPAPNAAGWLASAATVKLEAAAAGSASIASLTYWAAPDVHWRDSGQTIGATTVAGAKATVDVTTEGTTAVTFFATDSVGRSGPWQTVRVRIDRTPPVVTPPSVSVLSAPRIQRTSLASARVSWASTDLVRCDLQVRRGSGPYVPVPEWSRLVKGIPVGGGVPNDVITYLELGSTYRFRVRAVDLAGNVGPWVEGTAYRAKVYQGRDAAIVYSGRWKTVAEATALGGATSNPTATGAGATLTFTGNSVAWVAATHTAGGRASVYVDGVFAERVTFKKSPGGRRAVFQRTWSVGGRHTVEIRAEAMPIDVDAFLVTVPVTGSVPSVEEGEQLPAYNASGATRPVAQDMSPWGRERWSGGHQLYWAASDGDSVALGVAVGTPNHTLTLYMTRGPDYGIVSVSTSTSSGWSVPGASIDLYAPEVTPSEPVDLGTFTSVGTQEQLRILVVGKNPASLGYNVGIDVVILTPAPGPPYRQW